jgi:quercetin dioxygenase-like cupin family protein
VTDRSLERVTALHNDFPVEMGPLAELVSRKRAGSAGPVLLEPYAELSEIFSLRELDAIGASTEPLDYITGKQAWGRAGGELPFDGSAPSGIDDSSLFASALQRHWVVQIFDLPTRSPGLYALAMEMRRALGHDVRIRVVLVPPGGVEPVYGSERTFPADQLVLNLAGKCTWKESSGRSAELVSGGLLLFPAGVAHQPEAPAGASMYAVIDTGRVPEYTLPTTTPQVETTRSGSKIGPLESCFDILEPEPPAMSDSQAVFRGVLAVPPSFDMEAPL